jgi:hypothetical protein
MRGVVWEEMKKGRWRWRVCVCVCVCVRERERETWWERQLEIEEMKEV